MNDRLNVCVSLLVDFALEMSEGGGEVVDPVTCFVKRHHSYLYLLAALDIVGSNLFTSHPIAGFLQWTVRVSPHYPDCSDPCTTD